MKIQTIEVIAAAALLVGGITNPDAKDTKKVQASKKQPVKDKLNYDEAFLQKIKAAVSTGKLSSEEAAKKVAAMKKELGSKKKGKSKKEKSKRK